MFYITSLGLSGGSNEPNKLPLIHHWYMCMREGGGEREREQERERERERCVLPKYVVNYDDCQIMY
jgi:hypothetical protein